MTRIHALYRGHRVLFWMCVLIGVNQLGFGSIVPVISLYATSFGVSATAVGLTVAVYGLARFLLNVPTGVIADRFGRRNALALGGGVSVLGNVVCAASPDFATFVVGRFIAGAGAAMVLTSGQIVLADISTPANRGRMMATYQAVFLFAVGIGPLPGGVLADLIGLRAPFVAYALLAGAVSCIAFAVIPETRQAASHASRTAAPAFGRQIRMLAGNRAFVLVSLVSFTAFFARTGGLFTLIPAHAKDVLGLSASQIGLGLALISVMGLAVAVPSGMLADRYGRKSVIVPATLVNGGALVLFALAPGFAGFVGACTVWALAIGMSSSAPAAYVADIAPSGMLAATLSMYRAVADLGYIAGPLLLGLIADGASVETALYVTCGLVLVSGVAFAVGAPEPRRDQALASGPAG